MICTNSAHSWINQNTCKEILDRLDLLVVQDMYHTTETAELADLYLPAAGWGEKEGTFINSERRIGLLKKVAKAPGQALSDFSIFRLIAHSWGCEEMFAAWQEPEDVFQSMKELSRDQPCDITGIEDYQMLDQRGGIQWPYAEDCQDEESQRRLFADGQFYHADGKAKFLFEDPREMPEPPNERYPYLLLTGRGTASQWHTQTRTAKSSVLRALYPEDNYVEINPQDARRENISPNDLIQVESQRGRVKAKAYITPTIKPGQLFMPMHYETTNQLTLAHFDPYSRQPSYKNCAVRVRPVGQTPPHRRPLFENLPMENKQETLIVIGNGMVGHRFVEKLVEFDRTKQYKIVTFCEEARAAYDRVGLSAFLRPSRCRAPDARPPRLVPRARSGAAHRRSRPRNRSRPTRRPVWKRASRSSTTRIVLATGSYPFVPPVEGLKKRGVFVYRTIEDLERIIEFGQTAKTCAVIGGGLLGLEAAKAAYDLGLETHVIEFAPRLMPRQIDEEGSNMLVKQIENLGVKVHLNKGTKEVLGNGQVETMVFGEDDQLDVDMIIVSCGIRPRDEVAKDCGLTLGERGGVLINDALQTSDPDIFAIGEVATHEGMIYGLVAPGYEMAEVLAMNLTGSEAQFTGADLSTKLKLMGVDVASFGDYELPAEKATPLTYEDPFSGVYKKLFFDLEGKRLLGGILVGDASDFGTLSIMAKSGDELPCAAGDLLGGSSGGAAAALGGADSMPDDAQICSCNNVSKGDICSAITDQGMTSLADVKACHQGRHRLWRMYAAGDRHLQVGTRQVGDRGEQQPLRALCLLAARVVYHREG